MRVNFRITFSGLQQQRLDSSFLLAGTHDVLPSDVLQRLIVLVNAAQALGAGQFAKVSDQQRIMPLWKDSLAFFECSAALIQADVTDGSFHHVAFVLASSSRLPC